MNVLRRLLAACLAVVVSVSTAGAQVPHIADQATLDQVLSERVAEDAAKRAAIDRLLTHPEVETIASRFGVDVTQARAAVSTLDGAELEALAAQAQHVDNALAGGQSSITLSTTTIIIGLLVLILIIVAVN